MGLQDGFDQTKQSSMYQQFNANAAAAPGMPVFNHIDKVTPYWENSNLGGSCSFFDQVGRDYVEMSRKIYHQKQMERIRLAEEEASVLKWHHRFLSLAKHVAGWSKDPSTKVGCVIAKDKRIVSVGYNGFPEGIRDTYERLNNRELKYQIVQHAEENAIGFASESLEGCTMYTWPFASCSRCAGKLIQKRFKRLVYPKLTDPGLIERWGKSLELTFELLKEAGVETIEIEMEKE